ncbi:MAG TPA: hypothetical protein VF574_04490 [Allosphingosinicella sp.]|jgi:hypothetical protein
MAVMIQEMVTETAEAPPAAPAVPSAAPAGCDEPDIDKLEYQMARRRTRSARLWAD